MPKSWPCPRFRRAGGRLARKCPPQGKQGFVFGARWGDRQHARTILSLIFSGSIIRMPNIRFIFSHAGGTLPMVAGCIDHYSTLPAFKDKVPNGFDYELKPLYYEIANAAYKPSMAAITNMVPTSQIMFGTDFRWWRSTIPRTGAQPWACAHRRAGDRARQCDRPVPEVEGVARRQVGRESRLGQGSRRFLRHPRGRDG